MPWYEITVMRQSSLNQADPRWQPGMWENMRRAVIVTSDGVVHIGDPGWHHRDLAERDGFTQYNGELGTGFINVEKGGKATMWAGEQYIPQVEQEYQQRYAAEDRETGILRNEDAPRTEQSGWDAFATDRREPGSNGSVWNWLWEDNRRAVLIDPEGNVHIGEPSFHHDDLANRDGLARENTKSWGTIKPGLGGQVYMDSSQFAPQVKAEYERLYRDQDIASGLYKDVPDAGEGWDAFAKTAADVLDEKSDVDISWNDGHEDSYPFLMWHDQWFIDDTPGGYHYEIDGAQDVGYDNNFGDDQVRGRVYDAERPDPKWNIYSNRTDLTVDQIKQQVITLFKKKYGITIASGSEVDDDWSAFDEPEPEPQAERCPNCWARLEYDANGDCLNCGKPPKPQAPMQSQQLFSARIVLPGPMPFIFDIEKDRVYVGHPGERHSDLPGRFTPGGIVEGLYLPDGKVQLKTDTDMPYSVRHLVELWYYMHPELEVKQVFLMSGGKKIRLAKTENIGWKVRNLAATDTAAWDAFKTLEPYGTVYAVGGIVRDVTLGKIPKDVDLLVQGADPHVIDTVLSQLAQERGGRVDFTGKQFGVFRYRAPDGSECEIALPRHEVSTGLGHKDFEVGLQGGPMGDNQAFPDAFTHGADAYMPIEEDLARRDFTGNAMAVNLNCYSDDTETLTSLGWMGYDELRQHQAAGSFPLIASMNFDTDKIEYRMPAPSLDGGCLYSCWHDGPMILFENSIQSMLVTPNHRMYVAPMPGSKGAHKQHGAAEVNAATIDVVEASTISSRDRYAVRVGAEAVGNEQAIFAIPEYRKKTRRGHSPNVLAKVKKAKDLRGQGLLYREIMTEMKCSMTRVHQLLHPGKSLAGESDYKMQPQVDIHMDNWLDWLGWFLSEGSISNTQAVSVCQAVTSPFLADIQNACRTLGWPGVETVVLRKHKGQSDLWVWTANNPAQLGDWLKSNAGRTAFTKRIPDFVFDLSVRQQRILLRSLMLGDGVSPDGWEISGSSSYATTSAELANGFQRLALHCGFRAALKREAAKTSNRAEYYRIPLLAAHSGQVAQLAKPREVDYSGIVYCLTLPSGTMVTRRKGFVALQGNTGELIDPYRGSEHLKAGDLKLVNEAAFIDDPLRILRALAAVSRHQLTPDDELRQSMTDQAHRLKELPAERIQDELDKILSGDDPELAIRLMRDTGVLTWVLPEVAATVGFDQKSKYHRLHLDEHTMEVLRGVAEQTEDKDVRMAALMHDIGKVPSQWFDDEGYGHYYKQDNPKKPHYGLGADHAEVGAEMTAKRMRELKFPEARIKRVEHLVRHHMFHPFEGMKGARKFVQRVGPEHAMDLLKLRRADAEGKGSNEFENRVPVDMQEQLVNAVEAAGEPTGLAQLAIGGRDLIEAGLKPGPQFSMILQRLLDMVVENPALNNKETLVPLALSMANERTSNILDPVNDGLDPAVFDNAEGIAPVLKPKIAMWVHKHIRRVMMENAWPDPDKTGYLRLILTGSLTTYQWSANSDFDVSLWIDTQRLPDWVRADLIQIMVHHLDGTIVPGTTHPIQCFVVDPNKFTIEKMYKPGLRSAYDLGERRWLVLPERSRTIDLSKEFPELLRYAKMVADKMKLMLQFNPPAAKIMWHEIHDKRRRDQQAGKGDYSESNVCYKLLANSGLFPVIAETTGEYIAKKIGMAERSGDPQLDALIEQFMQTEYARPQRDDTTVNMPVETLRDPNEAWSHCDVAADHFVKFLQQHGVQAHRSDDPHEGIGAPLDADRAKLFTDRTLDIPGPGDHGYRDRPVGGIGEHTAVIVPMQSGIYMVDFTATQYGYTEFPMVQKLDDGNWQREWATAKTAAGQVNLTFQEVPGDSGESVLEAYVGHQTVGEVIWDNGRMEIVSIEVEPQFQRQGIASALYDELFRRYPEMKHSRTFTDQGKDLYESRYGPQDWTYDEYPYGEEEGPTRHPWLRRSSNEAWNQ